MGKYHEKKLKKACGCKKQKSKVRVRTCVFCKPCVECPVKKQDSCGCGKGYGYGCGCGCKKSDCFRPARLVLRVHQLRKHC